MSDKTQEKDQQRPFGERFSNSTPDPREGYWSNIDRSLQAVARSGEGQAQADAVEVESVDGVEKRDVKSSDRRLAVVDKLRFDRTSLLPVVAASVLLLVGVVGAFRLISSGTSTGQVSSGNERSASQNSRPSQESATAEPAAGGAVPTSEADDPDSSPIGLVPGEYCYILRSDAGATGAIELVVSPDGATRVRQSVDLGGQDETANVSNFKGIAISLVDERLTVSGEQWIEGGVQPKLIVDDVWSFAGNVITIGEQTSTSQTGLGPYIKTDCDDADRPVPDADSDPLGDLTVRVNEEIKFAPGTSSGSKSGAVIRGERDVYRVEVSDGQSMSVSITSVEDNAVFHLIGPDGEITFDEVVEVDGVATSAGVYQIVVGGTRGNATYELRVSVT